MRVRSPVERFATTQRGMTPGAGGGRTAMVAPEPRQLPKPETLQGSIRCADVVMAAADSPATAQEVDFKCGGSDDQDTLAAAYTYGNDTLGLHTPRILLLNGTYHFGDKFTADQVGAAIIEGEGFNWYDLSGTVIDGGGTADLFSSIYEGMTIKNLLVKEADLAFEFQGGNFTLQDVAFDNISRPVVLTEAAGSYVWYACKLKNLVIGHSCGNGGTSWLIDANWSNGNSLYNWAIEGIQFPGFFASMAGLLRLKQTASGPNMDYVTIANNPGLFGALIDGWDQGPVIANNHGGGDLEVRNVDDLVLVGNMLGDLTLHTISRFAHSGNIVAGTYSETAVTTKSAGSIGIT